MFTAANGAVPFSRADFSDQREPAAAMRAAAHIELAALPPCASCDHQYSRVASHQQEINQWLEENPLVLGGMFLVLGLVLLGFGVAALATGRSRSKYGRKLEGPMARVHGGVLAAAGAFCLVFALFKLFGAVL